MCVCTSWRRSVISRCAAFDNNCVREKEVTPWIKVASKTASTSGLSSVIWLLPTTSSIKNFEEYGSTNCASRLTSINRNPSASSQRRGRISFQTSGMMARSLSTLGVFWVGLGSVLNV